MKNNWLILLLFVLQSFGGCSDLWGIFKEEVDDSVIYRGFHKFGDLEGQFTLDEVNQRLAQDELKLTDLMQGLDCTSNVAFGAVTVITNKEGDTQDTVLHKIGDSKDEEGKEVILRVFESALAIGLPTAETSKKIKQKEEEHQKKSATLKQIERQMAALQQKQPGSPPSGAPSTSKGSSKQAPQKGEVPENIKKKIDDLQKRQAGLLEEINSLAEEIKKNQRLLRKREELVPQYIFEKELVGLPAIIAQVNQIWGGQEADRPWEGRGDLSPLEQEWIWKVFIQDQGEFLRKNERLKNLLIESSLEVVSGEVMQPFLTLSRSLHSSPQVTQAETLRGVITKKKLAPSESLHAFATYIMKAQGEVKAAENEFKQSINLFYNHFWHSEARLIYYLLNEESEEWWGELGEKIASSCVEGVFLHIHSSNDYCPRCRRALARVSRPGGLLWKKMQEQLKLKQKPFFFKVLGSFRVPYHLPLDTKKKPTPPPFWIPHYVFDPHRRVNIRDLAQEEDGLHPTPSFYLRRIDLGDEEEAKEDKGYLEAWKSHLTRWRSRLSVQAPDTSQQEAGSVSLASPREGVSSSSSASAVALATAEKEAQGWEDYLNNYYAYLHALVSAQEARIDRLEERVWGGHAPMLESSADDQAPVSLMAKNK